MDSELKQFSDPAQANRNFSVPQQLLRQHRKASQLSKLWEYEAIVHNSGKKTQDNTLS